MATYKYKHLTLDDRITIQKGLKEGLPFAEIASLIGKDPSTISKEVRGHLIVKETGTRTRPFIRVWEGKSVLCSGKLAQNAVFPLMHTTIAKVTVLSAAGVMIPVLISLRKNAKRSADRLMYAMAVNRFVPVR